MGRVLVTGGTGFVGGHAVLSLAASGHEPVLLVRDPTRVRPALADFEQRPGDITDRVSVTSAVSECDAVVHAAAIVTLDPRKAEGARRTNTEGTRTVLESAVECGADPVVFVSSIAALGRVEGVMGPDAPVTSSTSVYAASKAGAEQVARALQDDGAPVVTVYPGGVYGPEDPNVGEQTRGLMWGLRAGMAPAGSGGYPMVDARDLAAAIAASIEAGRGPRRYMLGGRFLTGRQFAAELSKVTGRRILALPVPANLLVGMGHAGDLVQRALPIRLPFTAEGMTALVKGVPFDNSAAEAQLGFHPRPAEETLTDAIRWLRESGLISRREAGRLG